MTFEEINQQEESLTQLQRSVYGDHLNAIVGAFYDDYYSGWMGSGGHSFCSAIFAVAHATLEQREEALKHTLNRD